MNRTHTHRTHIGDAGHTALTLREQFRGRYGRAIASRLNMSRRGWAGPEIGRAWFAAIGKSSTQRSCISRRKPICTAACINNSCAGLATADGGPGLAERRRFAADALGSYKNAQRLLDGYNALATKLTADLNPAAFESTMNELLELHITKEPEDEKSAKNGKPAEDSVKPIGSRVAEHLLEYMAVRYTNDRGTLLEIEALAGKQIPVEHDFSRPFVR